MVCAVSLAGGSLPAGLQWTLTSSAVTGPITVTAAGTAVTALKTTSSSTAGLSLLTGINANQIADGAVASVSIPIPVALSNQTVTFTLSGTLGASLAGSAVAETANPPVSVSVLSTCDINGDGLTNATDVTIEQNGVLAVPQTAIDLNKDGKRDVVDVQIVINAARNLGCTAQ
jgi:hypothetical protein